MCCGELLRGKFLCELQMIDHVASECTENPVSDDFDYSLWSEMDAAGVAAHTVP